MMAPYSPEQMEEVWCWIHNEQRCVTTLSVGLQLGLPRSVAAELLSKIPSHKQQQEVFEYECTFYAMVSEDEVNGATTTGALLREPKFSCHCCLKSYSRHFFSSDSTSKDDHISQRHGYGWC